MNAEPWKILSVDDVDGVHALLRLALEGFAFEGRQVQLLTASSAVEAESVLDRETDIAVAVIDVVMETVEAGLDLVRSIRERRHDLRMRLVIRTGQVESFPERELIADFEINDYWEKTETSVKRMCTSLTTCLRGYRDLLLLESRSFRVRQWADRFPDLLGVRDWMSLVRLVVLRLNELFPGVVPSTFLCRNDGTRWPMVVGSGRFPSEGAPDILPFVGENEVGLLLEAWNRRSFFESKNGLALYFVTHGNQGFLFYWEAPASWDVYDRSTARLILQNFRAALDNLSLIQDLENHKKELAATLTVHEDLLGVFHHRVLSGLEAIRFLLSSGGFSGDPLGRRASRLIDALSTTLRFTSVQRRLDVFDFSTILRALVESGWDFWTVPVGLGLDKALPLAVLIRDLLEAIEGGSPQRPESNFGVLRLVDEPRALTIEAVRPIDVVPLAAWSTLAEEMGGSFAENVSEKTVWKVSF